MSYTSVTNVSETGSDSTCQTRRHPYNTRLSNRSCNVKQSYKPKKVKTPKATTHRTSTFDFGRGELINAQLLQNDLPMDCCFDPCPTPPSVNRNKSWCTFLTGLFYFLLFAGASFVIYSQYLINTDIGSIKEEIDKLKGGHRREDPHAKLYKELDKKCRETLKLVLKDPVGRPDFALESSGGRVISVEADAYSSPKTFLGFNLCGGEHGPSSMIQATTSPGECWAFKGQSGKAVLQLIDYVLIDSVTLEHIPHTISPSGTIDTAPKDFKIWGLEKQDGNKLFLGEFKYEHDGGTVQTFSVNHVSTYCKFVEFEVLSNHGNKDFTCVYRLRVHGTTRKHA